MTTSDAVPAAAIPRETVTAARRGAVPASVVLLGSMLSLVGLTWDVQWHSDVGPDTFFTLPHLFLYSGSAVAGIASLAVVLMTTAATRAGRPVDPVVGGRAVGVFGRTFAAPVGYLVSGIGAALFLLYGLWDQWWHSLYGFDAVIDSPPHIGLLLSVTITMVGTVMIFAAARDSGWGRFGALGSIAVLLAFSTVTVLGLQQIDGYVDSVSAGVAALSVLLLLLAAGFSARPGGMALTALCLAVLQAVFWWFSPWAAHAYADLVGLPVRDFAFIIPQMPSLMPIALLPVAIVLEVLLWLVRKAHWPRAVGLVVLGALGGALLGFAHPVQQAWLYEHPVSAFGPMAATALTAAIVAALAGYAGWQLGVVLRLLAPAEGGAR